MVFLAAILALVVFETSGSLKQRERRLGLHAPAAWCGASFGFNGSMDVQYCTEQFLLPWVR
jgi:hypothetical protein